MGTRKDLIYMRNNLREINLSVDDINELIRKFISLKNSAIWMITDAPQESAVYTIHAKNVVINLLHTVFSRTNSDTNLLINHICKSENEDYRRILSDNLGAVVGELDKIETETIMKIRNFPNNFYSTWVSSFLSKLESVMIDLVFKPLNYAYEQILNMNNPSIVSLKNTKKEIEREFEINSENQADLYWTLVFFYFFRSSRIITGMLTQKGINARPSDIITGIQAGVQRGISRALNPQLNTRESVEKADETENEDNKLEEFFNEHLEEDTESI